MRAYLISAVFLFSFIVLVAADRKPSDTEEETEIVDAQRSKGQKRIPDRGRGGQCSCRDLENNVEQLEFRLDRMIDLWNDFVDKNRNPYDQRQGPYPPPRTPPQGGIGGGRGPYLHQDGRVPPRRPGFGGRGITEDEQGASPRRFQF